MNSVVRLKAVIILVLASASGVSLLSAQPSIVGDGVQFTYVDPKASSVVLLGDFNGWTKESDPLTKDSEGTWMVVRSLRPGTYQYKFLVNGLDYQLDPTNPAQVDNYNRSAKNSVFVLTQSGSILLASEAPYIPINTRDVYPASPGKKPVYLNIIWHQHQPLYANPETDQLSGPWVRTHATKDYYDMAAILSAYRDVHCTINLTTSLLQQLQDYYVKRLGPYIDTKKNHFDVEGFLRRWRGKTDPWIDLALKPTSQFTSTDKGYLYGNAWNCFGISEVMLERFPEYKALRDRWRASQAKRDDVFSEQQMREIKFWFYLAQFDPDFLQGPVRLPDGSICNVSRYVERRFDGKWYLTRGIREEDCRRIVLEAYKVIAAVIPVHRGLRYSPTLHTGQIDIITTPYYHPILPLIYDSDLARTCQPNDSLPPRYSYPADAEAQVSKAVQMYTSVFGSAPTGMWPGEGSVAQPVLEILRKNGILWTASDVRVLQRSRPANQPNNSPYRFPAGDRSLSLVFRDTELSDRIGFKYQTFEGEVAAEDFVQSILAFAADASARDVLITVILDGENAWEWYQKDEDGKQFLHALYRKLSVLYKERRIITTTMSEYLYGNPQRGIAPHPAESQPSMEWLWPGSWINGNYDTWIGEPEENKAWEYLLQVRQDLGKSRLAPPKPGAKPPREGSREWFAFMAWEEMYAAEGSDWFWWYGADQTAPAGDRPFDTAFLIHLKNIYTFARRAGAEMPERSFEPIIRDLQTESASTSTGQGTMAKSSAQMQTVVFRCDARGVAVSDRISIAGNLEALGSWKPNVVALRDDGLAGDEKAGDGIWSLMVELPLGSEVQYVYTSDDRPEELPTREEISPRQSVERVGGPARHRTTTIRQSIPAFIINDTFGR